MLADAIDASMFTSPAPETRDGKKICPCPAERTLCREASQLGTIDDLEDWLETHYRWVHGVEMHSGVARRWLCTHWDSLLNTDETGSVPIWDLLNSGG